jgi:ethanolamine utilization protein EutP
MKKKIMFIGNSRTGKTRLANCINKIQSETRRTQMVTYGACTIDTPGEYIENPLMYRHVIAASQDAGILIFVLSYDQPNFSFPPNFALMFNTKKVGVFTKSDLPVKKHTTEILIKKMKETGIQPPYFITSTETMEGINEMLEYIDQP